MNTYRYFSYLVALILFFVSGNLLASYNVKLLSIGLFANHIFDGMSDDKEYINPYSLKTPFYEYKELLEWNGSEKSTRPNKFDVVVFFSVKNKIKDTNKVKIKISAYTKTIKNFNKKIDYYKHKDKISWDSVPLDSKETEIQNNFDGISYIKYENIPLPVYNVCDKCKIIQLKITASIICDYCKNHISTLVKTLDLHAD